jgi:hypothetical protein
MMNQTFKIKIDGKMQTIKMTMGLLHEVCATIGHVQLLPEAIYNPEIRQDLLVALLSPRDEDGEITSEIKVKTLNAEPSEVLNLLQWAVEHGADFLLNALRLTQQVLEARKDQMVKLTPT